MALRKFGFFNTAEVGWEEAAATDSLQLGGLTMSGDIAMGSNEVTGLPSTPSGSTAATSKAYVDAVASGLDLKDSCRLATAAALPAYTPSGSGVGKTLTADANGALSLDSVAVSSADRVLIKDENSGGAHVDHGIYTVTATGDGSNPWVLTRATDFDQDSEVTAGSFTFVTEGSTQADTGWVVSTNDPITVDTTAIDWTQFSSAGVYTGGDGIDITGSVISVDLATNPGLEFSTGQLQVKLDGTTLQVGASGLSVKGLPSLFEINGTAVGATVTAPNLDTLTDGSDADALHTHNEVSGYRLEDELTAVESLNKADVVEWSTTADKMQKCQASSAAKQDAFGIVEEAGGIAADGTGTVVLYGEANVLTGATAGDRYYVGDSGGIVVGIGSISAGNHVLYVGCAKNATILWFRPQYIGKKAA